MFLRVSSSTFCAYFFSTEFLPMLFLNILQLWGYVQFSIWPDLTLFFVFKVFKIFLLFKCFRDLKKKHMESFEGKLVFFLGKIWQSFLEFFPRWYLAKLTVGWEGEEPGRSSTFYVKSHNYISFSYFISNYRNRVNL